MPVSNTQAVDQLYEIVKNAAATLNTVYGYNPEIRWPGVPKPRPDQSKTWMRVSHKVVQSKQSTLGDVAGKKRYTTTGLLFIQLFASRTEVNAKETSRYAASVLRDAFRVPSASGEFIFRDQKIVELETTPENYPSNIIVTFEYDEIGPGIETVADLGLPAWSKPHHAVEAQDGIRTIFTFVGLPALANEYAVVVNGLLQSGYIQTLNQVDLGFAPVVDDVLLAYY